MAILHLYEGRTGLETAKLLRTSYSSMRRWAKRWNKKGHNGLIPHFTGGPKPKITSDVWDKILGEIENKGMTLKDVKVYVKTKHGVDYDYNSVWYWVRKKKKTRYGKPYLEDERRPKDAEEILKKG